MLGLGLQLTRRVIAVGGSVVNLIWNITREIWDDTSDNWDT